MPLLRKIYPEGDDSQTRIDIVAVHGLNPESKEDHALLTWTQNGRCWLKDDLGPDLGIARVFLFEYKSNPGEPGHQRLVDEAENLLVRLGSRKEGPRPLIFVAHSLGGLLVKNAFVRAQSSDEYKPIIDAVLGMVCFAVPHRGANKLLSTLGDALFSIHSRVPGSSKSDFIDAVKRESFSSYTLKEHFTGHLKDLRVLSLYEGRPHRAVKCIIVDKESATFGVPLETKTKIDADHSDICRFDTREDEGRDSYLIVETYIQNVILRSAASQAATPAPAESRQLLLEHSSDDEASKTGSRPIANQSSTSLAPYYTLSSPSSRSPDRSRYPPERAYGATNGGPPLEPHIFRISNFDVKLSPNEIRDRLNRQKTKKAPSYRTGLPGTNIQRLFHAPFDNSHQTAVVELKRRPNRFPKTKNLGDEYRLSDEATGWSTWRRTRLEADAHFHGLTPLGLSWSDDDGRTRVGGEASDPWITRALGESEPSELQRIRVDIIVLTPLLEHPYDYWRNENGSMWIADFLKYEGFDGARILVLGSTDTKPQQTDLLRLLPSRKPTILVDLPKSGSEELYSALLCGPDGLPAQVGFVVLSDGREFPASEKVIHLSPDDHLSYPADVRFSNNRDRIYRWIVDSIWELIEHLLMSRPAGILSYLRLQWPPSSSKKAKGKVADYGPGKLLSELLVFLKRSGSIDVQNGNPDGPTLGNDSYGILKDDHFQSWLKGEPYRAIQVAMPPRANYKAFRDALRGCKPQYKIIHVDCGQLSKFYGPSGNYGKGSALIGPLLLWISKVIIKTWKLNDGEFSGALESFLGDLFEAYELLPTRPPLEDLPAAITKVIEHLGTNLALVAAKSIGKLHDFYHKPPTNVMIVVDLHDFLKSPERGRMIHSICKFHRKLKQDLDSRLLFMHNGDGDLEGLLSHALLINDDEFRECLSSLNSSKLFNRKTIDGRHEGTLEWFWEDEQFRLWRESKRSAILCVWRKPACGKSVLSRSFSSNATDGEGGACATVFFHDGRPGTAGPRAMMQAILHDILKHHGRSLFPVFQKEFLELKERGQSEEEGGYKRVLWDRGSLERVAEKLAQRPLPETFVVIDGLDESGDPLSCTESLHKLFPPSEEGGICLKLLVATRDDAQVKRRLETPLEHLQGSLYEITLQEKNRNDILQYTKSFLNDSLTKKLKWTPDMVEKARDLVCERSHGIFLWAKLARSLFGPYLDSREISSYGEFEKQMRKTPQSLEKFYAKLLGGLIDRLNRVGPKSTSLLSATKMFRLAAQAQERRPLSKEEFCDAYALLSYKDNGNQTSLEEHRPTMFLDLIPELTANILEYYRETNVVDFLHPTAVEFLSKSNKKIRGTPMSELMADPEELPDTKAAPASGPFAMGTVCIWYLQYVSSDLEKDLCWTLDGSREHMSDFAKALDDYPFLVYATEYFCSHVWDKGNGAREAVELFNHTLTSPLRYLVQGWALKQVKKQRQKLPKEVMGNMEPAREIRGFVNSVLHCAAAEGYSIAARVALLAGAEVDSRSTLHDFKENALCLISIHYQDERSRAVGKILLEFGAKVNAETGIGGAPLHYAGKYMAEEVLELLLDHGAEVHSRDRHDMTPLHRTVIGKRRKPPESPPDDTGGPRQRPLGEASLPCAERLVDAGADVNVGDDKGQKPIHWAAGLSGRLEFVKFLANAQGSLPHHVKAAVNTQCAYQRLTPLLWASGYGNHDAVKYLIDAGAQIDYADIRGKTAANWASRYGHSDILETLLRKLEGKGGKGEVRAFVNQTESSGRSPLIWACSQGHCKCVEVLVSAGADPNHTEYRENGTSSTPLSWAVSKDYGGIVEFLVQKGADLMPDTSRPLIGWAAKRGNKDRIRYLLDTAQDMSIHLDLDEPDKIGRTPFMLAASNGHVETLPFLQQLQAQGFGPIDPHRNDRWGNTALHLAAGWGHLEVVEWLVETARLNINHMAESGDTALHRAEEYRREDVAAYLRRKGARTDVKNERGFAWNDQRQRQPDDKGYEPDFHDQDTSSEFEDLEAMVVE